jgi:hypothetical protein
VKRLAGAPGSEKFAVGEQGRSAMIGKRQIDFRKEYRSRIIGWYNGYFHIVLIYAMGAAVFYV